MRVAKIQLRMAVLVLAALAGSSCQTAQKPVSLLPARTAPAITSSSPAVPAPAPQTQPPVAQTDTHSQPTAPAAEAEPEAASAAPTSDLVGDLIASVEKEYQAGLANYHAGQADAAKQNFDNAFNALLGSNLDIRSDERLEKEFERITEGVNQ